MTLKPNNVSATNLLIFGKFRLYLGTRDISQFNQTSSQGLLGFDKGEMLRSVEQRGSELRYASDELRGDKDVVLKAVKQDGLALKYVSEALRGDKDVVLTAVKQNGLALEHASEDLKGSLEVTVAAIINNRDSGNFSYIDDDSKRKIMDLEALMKSGEPGNEGIRNVNDDLSNLIHHIRTLGEIEQEILKDPVGVLFFVVQNGRFLQYFTDFQCNVDVVQAAVRQEGLVLAYASKDLKSDRDVVLAAVKQNGDALKYASSELCADNTLVAEAKKNTPNPFGFPIESMRDTSGELRAGSTLVAEAGSGGRDNQATSEMGMCYPSTVGRQFPSSGPTAGVFTIVDNKHIKLIGRP